MTASLAHIGPAMTAAFLASLVEAVEALTIVLAVATVRGWRPAGLGALAGLTVLVLIVVALGPLLGHVPLRLLQFAIGVLLLGALSSFLMHPERQFTEEGMPSPKPQAAPAE